MQGGIFQSGQSPEPRAPTGPCRRKGGRVGAAVAEGGEQPGVAGSGGWGPGMSIGFGISELWGQTPPHPDLDSSAENGGVSWTRGAGNVHTRGAGESGGGLSPCGVGEVFGYLILKKSSHLPSLCSPGMIRGGGAKVPLGCLSFSPETHPLLTSSSHPQPPGSSWHWLRVQGPSCCLSGVCVSKSGGAGRFSI